MGQANEGMPVVIIKGVDYSKRLRNEPQLLILIIRLKEYDVFR